MRDLTVQEVNAVAGGSELEFIVAASLIAGITLVAFIASPYPYAYCTTIYETHSVVTGVTYDLNGNAYDIVDTYAVPVTVCY